MSKKILDAINLYRSITKEKAEEIISRAKILVTCLQEIL